VQLSLPLRSPREPTRHALAIGGRTYDVAIVRHRRARRYLLRVCSDSTLRLTVPRGADIDTGLRFAANQVVWIERERVRLHRRTAPWMDGSVVLFRGREERLRVDGTGVWCAGLRMSPGGADMDVRADVEQHLRELAGYELPGRCLALAALHGLRVARVSVRDQKSRWGSCSRRGAIALNWRLVQMPPRVSDYVVLHELMHLRQPNHSRRFWREVEAVCPDWRDCERWLRRHGKEIL
jgi:predicted metal-dependent hydrolase